MQKIINNYWLLIILILTVIFLRLINLEKLFYFTYDESIPAFVARRLILWNHIPLIGGATPMGFHLGPYFYWLLTFILFLGQLNPIAWGWAGAIISAVTVILIFIAGKTFSSKKVGTIAAILWTFSHLTNIYDRHFWALYWGPLLSLATILLIYKIHKGKDKLVILLSLVLAFGVHSDPSNLMFLLLAMISWFFYKIPIKKMTIFAILIFIISFLPLLVFDLRHDFANIKPVSQYFNNQKSLSTPNINNVISNILIFPRSASRLIYVSGDNEISKQYSYCKNFVIEKYKTVPFLLVFALSLMLIIFIKRNLNNKKRQGWQMISTLIVLYFLGISVYGSIFNADIYEHYLTGLFPVFLLIIAKYLAKLPNSLWILIIALFIAINLNKVLNIENKIGFSNKKEAIKYTMQEVGIKPFSIDSLSTCWKYSGYRYLFTIFGREPVKSYVDPNFAYLYGTTPVDDAHPDIVVSFVIHDFVPETQEFYKRYAVLKSREISSKLFGNIEVIIIDNSSRWF